MKIFDLFVSPNGRISRRTYWLASLFLVLVCILSFLAIERTLGRPSTLVLYPFYFWALFSLCAKRYHDVGKSSAWLIILALPVIGVIWVNYELGWRRGTQSENRFGAPPDAPGLDYLTVKIPM